jgi:hypothetical protein
MAGLVPAIHAAPLRHAPNMLDGRSRVDGRDKPGHDGVGFNHLSSMGRG